MGIFNFDLDQTQPRNEPKSVKPARRVPVRPLRPKQFKNSLPSPRGLGVDLTLIAGSKGTSPTPRVVFPDMQVEDMSQLSTRPDMGVVTQLREQVLLVKQGLEDKPMMKLARPIWPKSTPTIPSTFFKGNFSTQVELMAWLSLAIIQLLTLASGNWFIGLGFYSAVAGQQHQQQWKQPACSRLNYRHVTQQ